MRKLDWALLTCALSAFIVACVSFFGALRIRDAQHANALDMQAALDTIPIASLQNDLLAQRHLLGAISSRLHEIEAHLSTLERQSGERILAPQPEVSDVAKPALEEVLAGSIFLTFDEVPMDARRAARPTELFVPLPGGDYARVAVFDENMEPAKLESSQILSLEDVVDLYISMDDRIREAMLEARRAGLTKTYTQAEFEAAKTSGLDLTAHWINRNADGDIVLTPKPDGFRDSMAPYRQKMREINDSMGWRTVVWARNTIQ